MWVLEDGSTSELAFPTIWVLEISGFRVFAVSKKTSCTIMARVAVLTRNECVSLSHSFPCLVLDTLRALHRVRFSFPTHLPLFYLIYKLVDHASSLYLLASSVLRPFPAGLQPSWRLWFNVTAKAILAIVLPNTEGYNSGSVGTRTSVLSLATVAPC